MNLTNYYLKTLFIIILIGFIIKKIYSLKLSKDKSLNVFIILLITILVVTILSVQLQRKLFEKSKQIVPKIGDQGSRGFKGDKGNTVKQCKCDDDSCYKKIMFHITLVYNEWCILRGYKTISKNQMIRNKFIKQKVKMMCNSDIFKKLLYRNGSHKFPYTKLLDGLEKGWKPCKINENCGAYDYILEKWRQWILIILKYENGKYFLDSEDLTDSDYTTIGKNGMITEIDKIESTKNKFVDEETNNPIWIFNNPLIFPNPSDTYICEDFEKDPEIRCKNFFKEKVGNKNYANIDTKLKDFVEAKKNDSSMEILQKTNKEYNIEVNKYKVTLDYFVDYFGKNNENKKPLFKESDLKNSDFYKFYNFEGVPSAGKHILSPFDEIRKFDSWYWGANDLSKPQILETCNIDRLEHSEDLPKIKVKISNNYNKLWDSKNIRQSKIMLRSPNQGHDTYIPYKDKGRSLLKNDNKTQLSETSQYKESVDVFRAKEFADEEEEELNYKYYKPLGDVMTNSNYIRKTNSKCHPQTSDNKRPASQYKNGPKLPTLIVSGDVEKPIGFKRRFIRKRKEGTDKNKIGYSLWSPIPPPGYKCLGDVISTNVSGREPSKESIVCIPNKCIKERRYNNNEIKKIYTSNDIKEDDINKNVTFPSVVKIDTDYDYKLGDNVTNPEFINVFSNLNDNDPDLDYRFVEFDKKVKNTSKDELKTDLLSKQNLFRVILDNKNVNHLKHEPKLNLLSSHNTYLFSGENFVSSKSVNNSEFGQDIFIEKIDEYYCFKNIYGKYMSAQPNGTIQWNRDNIGSWEKFLVKKRGNYLTIMSYHKKFLSAQPTFIQLNYNNRNRRGEFRNLFRFYIYFLFFGFRFRVNNTSLLVSHPMNGGRLVPYYDCKLSRILVAFNYRIIGSPWRYPANNYLIINFYSNNRFVYNVVEKINNYQNRIFKWYDLKPIENRNINKINIYLSRSGYLNLHFKSIAIRAEKNLKYTESTIQCNRTGIGGWEMFRQINTKKKGATLFQHGNFTGWKAYFDVGRYNTSEFIKKGAKNDDASSIIVEPGYKVKLYQHDNFKGWVAEFNAGSYPFSEFIKRGAVNDDASSIIVEFDNYRPKNNSSFELGSDEKNLEQVFYSINPQCIYEPKSVKEANPNLESVWDPKLRDAKYSAMNVYK